MMKRSLAAVLVFLLVIGALTGCGPNQEKIMEDFYTILDKPASEKTIKEANEYVDQYLAKIDEKYAEEMIIKLEAYILGFDQEGINYEDWTKRYDKYIGKDLKDLYKLKIKEQRSPMAEDAVLKISWNELLQRTYDMEQYIRKYKDQELIQKDAGWMYRNYVNALVMGTNGTPVFDYKTYGFSEDAKTAYAAFINKYPDSVTSWALTEYFTYLNSNQFTLDYNDKAASKTFFDTCDWLVSESGKRVFQ
jgi:hypothetical protein